MPMNRLIFILVTVLALAGGTVALFANFVNTSGTASLPQIILLSVAVAALALGVRFIAQRTQSDNDN